MPDIYSALDSLHISFIRHDHPPLFTVEEAEAYYGKLPGGKTKNLFLRSQKKDAHYLVIVDARKRVDMKALSQALGVKFSFANADDLMKYLGLTPGSVSPFGLINDENKYVRVVVDEDIWNADPVNFHPNVNTATLELSQSDFRKFLDSRGNPVTVLKL